MGNIETDYRVCTLPQQVTASYYMRISAPIACSTYTDRRTHTHTLMINEVALLFTGLFFGVHPGNKPELGFLPLPLHVDEYKKRTSLIKLSLHK